MSNRTTSTWLTVPEEFDFSQCGEMDPHGDVGSHLERQKLQDLVFVETLLSRPGVRHPAFDAVLIEKNLYDSTSEVLIEGERGSAFVLLTQSSQETCLPAGRTQLFFQEVFPCSI